MTAGEPAQEPAEAGQPSATQRSVRAGLELLELEVDEAELAVIEVVDSLYRPLTEALIVAELDGVEPEPGADMSDGPRAVEER
jgi:hypothetical protein